MVSNTDRQDQLSWSDLREHFLWWLRLLYSFLRFCGGVIARYPLPVLAAAALGAALSIGQLYRQAQSYEIRTTFVYGELHPKVYGDMIDKLNALIADGQHERAADLMGVSSSSIRQLAGIQVSDSRGRPLSTNYTMKKEPMLIQVTLNAPLPEDTLRRAISYYLNSNPFTSERLELRKRQLQEELLYLDAKLRTVDSILTNLYAVAEAPAPRSGEISIGQGEGKDAYELLKFSQDLLRRKADVENQLISPEYVFAIDNFVTLPKVKFNWKSAAKRGLLGALAAYALVALLVFWQEHLRPIVTQS